LAPRGTDCWLFLFFFLLFVEWATMLVGMVLSGFGGVVGRMQAVSVRHVGMMRRFFVLSLLVMFAGLAVVGRRILMMFSRLIVMFRSFVLCHSNALFLGEINRTAGGKRIPRSSPIEFYIARVTA
jgi:hypothetical protein